MAVSNPATLSSVRAEFGGDGRLRQYTRGGGLVPNGPPQNNNIATDVNSLRLSQFAGAIRIVTPTLQPASTSTSIDGPGGTSCYIFFAPDGNVYINQDGYQSAAYRWLPNGMSAGSYAANVNGTWYNMGNNVSAVSASAYGDGFYDGSDYQESNIYLGTSGGGALTGTVVFSASAYVRGRG